MLTVMFAESFSWMRICPFIYWRKKLFHPELNNPAAERERFLRHAALLFLFIWLRRPEPDMFLLRLVSQVTYCGMCSGLVIWVQQRKYLLAAGTRLQRAFLRPAAEWSPLYFWIYIHLLCRRLNTFRTKMFSNLNEAVFTWHIISFPFCFI